jgi:hypothetical protein
VYHDFHIILAVAVLDAPMLAAKMEGNESTLTLTPWVRVVRQEAFENPHPFERTRQYVVDVVHRQFLKTYIDSYVTPFAGRFAELALKHDVELASGKASTKSLTGKGFVDFEQSLQPR